MTASTPLPPAQPAQLEPAAQPSVGLAAEIPVCTNLHIYRDASGVFAVRTDHPGILVVAKNWNNIPDRFVAALKEMARATEQV